MSWLPGTRLDRDTAIRLLADSDTDAKTLDRIARHADQLRLTGAWKDARSLTHLVALHAGINRRTLQRINRDWGSGFIPLADMPVVAAARVRIAMSDSDPVAAYHNTIAGTDSAPLVEALHTEACLATMPTSPDVLHEIAVLHLPDWAHRDNHLTRQHQAGLLSGTDVFAEQYRFVHGKEAALHDRLVRIANHPNVAPATLTLLWQEASQFNPYYGDRLRIAILASPSCPPGILTEACHGKVLRYADEARANPACPPEDAVVAALRA